MISFFQYKRAGRNNDGRITVRHRGAGSKFLSPNFCYLTPSLISSRLNSFNFNTGNFTAFISPNFSNHLYKYNIYFNRFNAASDFPKYIFECTIGQFLYNLELTPGFGPKICRSFGARCQLLRKRGTYATVRFPSGEIRRVSIFCTAKIWRNTANAYTKPEIISSGNRYKAGFNRYLGIRPHVRGCAINPVDHPHGGRTGESRPSVSPWAQLTKGYRTRFKQINRKFVLLSVQDMKNKSKLA